MIHLTRLNGTELWVNPLLIETIERTPDTIVTLTNSHKYVVRDTPDEIRLAAIHYLREIGIVAANQMRVEQKDGPP